MASIDAMTTGDVPICPKWVRSPIWRRRVEKALHKFSSTQFNIEDASYTRTQGSPRHKIEAMARRIADEDLAKDGREDRPHVTVKYGLHTGNVEEVRRVVQGFGTVKIKLGKTSLFPASKDHPFEVVKIDVSGDSLHRLNRLITNSVECTDTHPTYKPHVTLAYVKPGAGKKYVGMTDVDGMEISCHRLVFSDQDKNKTAIYLDGITKALPAPVGAPRIAKPKNGLPPGFSGIAPPDAAGRRYQYINGRRVNRTDNDNLPDNDAGKQTPPPEPPSMPSQTSQQPQAQTQPFTAPKMPQQPAQQQPEQSQSQQWSVSPAASSVINNHRANAEQRGKQAIDKVTSSWNGPKDDVAKQELASKLKQSFDQAEITINFKPSTTSIFESGMLKTAYETSKGNKGYLGARKKQEKEVLGAGDDMQHSDRPVYAAVNWDKNLYGAASPYGHASFVLNRDAIKERATLTPRDTWGLRNSDEVATMDNPLAAIATNDKALKTAGYKEYGVDDKIVHGSGAYTEVQIWGGSMPLNKQTVKEIRLPNGGAYEHEAQAAKAFADKHGITLTVFDPKNGKTVAFDQAQFAKKKPSLWNRLLGRKSMSRKHLRRSPIWKALKRKNVSGLRRDSRGREYLWVNGKRVAKPKTVGEPIDGRGLEKIASLAEKAIFESLNQVADLVNAVKVIGGGVVSGVNKGQELYGKFTDYIDSQVKKLPGPVEKVVRGAYKLYCAPYAMAQKATGELAKEHGFSPATVHRISATVAVVDFVAGKAQSLFGVGSSSVPLGSLAYLVFATAVHPVATYRAARKGIERARTKLGVVKGMLPEATMVALGERMEKYGEDYFAAFLVAMDTERDAKKAMRLADEVVRGREQEEKRLDLTAHILAGIVGGMVTKSMRAFVIKATKRREGEQWVTNGRHYRRSGGKTVRIAPPGAKEETPAKPSSKDAKYAAAKDAVDRLKGGDPNAVDEVMESLGKLTVPQLRALAKEQGFAKVSGRAKKEILDGLKAGLVPGNSAVGGGTSVGSRGSSSAAVSDDGPKEGDRNAEGLVFRNSRWHREDRPEEREEEIGQHVGNGTTKNGRNVSFVPNRYGVMSGGETTIIIDPAKLDQAWKKESHYLPADGRGVSEKMGGRKEFRHFLETGEAVESSRLALGLDGSVDFVDGRHRFAVLRDAGIDKMAVSVPKHQINQFRERFGLDAKADSSKEPWQMTVGDWSKWEAEAFGTSPREPSQRQKEWYLGQVRDAIADGKPVPAEVLADYPDLKLKDDAPKSSRQTPSKGTPERDKQDAEWNDTYAKVEAAAEAASKVKEERDNTKRSTKKYDTLDAKYRKLQDEYEAMHRDMQPLRKLNRLALLEDTIEHGDEANAIAAKAMMDREAGNNKRHDDAYTKIMSLAEASLKSNYGLTDSDAIKSIAMDATSMVLGYPGIESTLDVRLKGAVTTYNRKTANRVNREAIDALNDLSKEQKASFHRRVENAEFAPDTQSQIIAEAKAENESNRELNKLAAEHEKRAEESRQEREAFDPDIDSIPVKSIRTKGLIKGLNVDGRWGFIGTAKATGYATNGKYMFKLPEKEMAVIRSTPDNGNRTLPQQTLDTLLNSNHEVEPATIKGVRHLEDVDLNSPTYLIESPNGTQALMNATYVRLILDRYPNATMHLPPPVEKSKSTTRPVVFKDQGTVIGVVMPIEDGRKYKVKG